MKQQKYLTQEEYQAAKLQAMQEVPKILKHTVTHTMNGLPESLGFKAAYDDIMADPGNSIWNMAQMYEYGRIAGIKVERERRNAQKKKREYIDLKRKELIENYPEMKDSIEKVSDVAIEMVIALEGMEKAERDTFRKYLESRI